MKIFWKRLIASVLLICFCFSLLPVSPAAAADSLTNHHGLVFDYATTEINGESAVKITINTYGVDQFYSNITICLAYNSDKLMAITSAGDTVMDPSEAVKFPKIPASIVDTLLIASTEMAKGSRSPFKDCDIIEGSNPGEINIGFNVGDNYSNYLEKSKLDTDGDMGIKFPTNEVIPLIEVYLKPQEGIDINTLTSEDLFLYKTDSSFPLGYTYANSNGEDLPSGIDAPIFRNWPAAPPEYGNVTVNVGVGASNPVSGMKVSLTSKSADGATVPDGTTDENGAYTFSNVPTGDYTLSIAQGAKGTAKDGKVYQLLNAYTNDVTVTKDQTVSRSVQTESLFQEVKDSYAFTIKAVNASGEDVSLADTNLDSTAVTQNTDGSAASGQLAVKTAGTGNAAFTLKGLDSYQAANATVTISGSGSVVSGITPVSDNVTVEGTVVTVKLSKTTTNVTIPLPVPNKPDSEEPIDKTQAEKLEVTFKPNTDDAKAELGEGGTKGNITVTEGPDGKLNISVSDDLPDGSYTVTIGGEGFGTSSMDVTVITTEDESGTPIRVVNVGGEPKITDGEVETVTGGVTATKPATDTTSNGAVNLDGTDSGTTIVEGGTIDMSGATPSIPTTGDAGVKDVTGGLLGSETAKDPEGLGGQITPSMDTDPMYDITVDWVKNGTAYTGVTAAVVLKNTAAHNGTFGMYFDKNVFGDPLEPTNNGITVTPGTGLNLVHGKTSGPEINVGDDTSDGYVYFEWGAVQSGTELPSGTTIATITLPIRSNLLTNNAFMDNLDDHSIYTMKYTLTKDGKATIDEYIKNLTDAFQEMDANERQQILDAAVATIWRAIEYKPLDTENGAGYGVANGFYLDDAKAQRGGFYRFYRGTEAEAGSGRDIRMNFKLPDEFNQKTRVDFWASEPDTNDGIEGAQIYIVKDDPTVLATYADQLAAGMTQDQLDADNALKVVTRLDTDQDGLAYLIQEDGTYYFAVYEKSHWAYPNGTTTTDEDHLTYAAYTVADHVVTPLKVTVANPDDSTKPYEITVPYNSDAINPQMAAKTYHEVALEGDGTKDGATTNLSVRPTIAYNAVRYYFTITPDAGYSWKSGSNMSDVAAELNKTADNGTPNAALYVADKNAASKEDIFRSLEEGAAAPTALKVEWDATRKMFYIDGDADSNKIGGAPVGVDTWGTDPDTITLDALRAGDIVLTLPAAVQDMIEKATYTITATAGNGGSIQAVAPETPNADSSFTKPDSYNYEELTADDTNPTQTIVERLGNGLTESHTYTFKPTGTNKIAKVIVNGVEQTITDQQKVNGFSYTFKNISADQTIYVTFVDASGNQLSDPYISVSVGDNGKAEVYKNDATDPNKLGEVPGGQSGSFTTPEGDKIVLTITPDLLVGGPLPDGSTKYVIDQLLVNGEDWKDGAHLTDNGDGTYKVTLPTDTTDPTKTLSKGDTFSVAVTFKPDKGNSTHVIVTSSIDYGFGVLSPMGTNVYAIGDTPKFVLTPNTGWTVRSTDDHKAIMLDGVDRSTGVVKDAGGEFSYTLPALTGNSELIVCFAEETVTVSGRIQVQAVTQLNANPAKLTFTRAANPATGTDETTVIDYSEAEVKTLSIDGGTGQIMAFTAEVPVGNWTLLVEKHGYLTYTITGFEVTDGDEHIHFGAATADCNHANTLEACTATAKPIVLTAGDAAGDGLSIAVNDTATVTAGWLSGAAGSIAATKGNLNEDTHGVDTSDMGLVTGSLYKVRTKTSYTKFCGLTQINKAV